MRFYLELEHLRKKRLPCIKCADQRANDYFQDASLQRHNNYSIRELVCLPPRPGQLEVWGVLAFGAGTLEFARKSF